MEFSRKTLLPMMLLLLPLGAQAANEKFEIGYDLTRSALNDDNGRATLSGQRLRFAYAPKVVGVELHLNSGGDGHLSWAESNTVSRGYDIELDSQIGIFARFGNRSGNVRFRGLVGINESRVTYSNPYVVVNGTKSYLNVASVTGDYFGISGGIGLDVDVAERFTVGFSTLFIGQDSGQTLYSASLGAGYRF